MQYQIEVRVIRKLTYENSFLENFMSIMGVQQMFLVENDNKMEKVMLNGMYNIYTFSFIR